MLNIISNHRMAEINAILEDLKDAGIGIPVMSLFSSPSGPYKSQMDLGRRQWTAAKQPSGGSRCSC